MQNNLVRVLIAATILILILGGLFLGNSLYNKPSSEETLASLGVDAKEYSNAVIKKNNTTASCWTIVGGVVYDATAVIKSNPEHANILVKACGTDGTSIYTILKYSQQPLDNETIVKLKDELFAYKLGIIAPTQ